MNHHKGITSVQAQGVRSWTMTGGDAKYPYRRGVRYTAFGIVDVLACTARFEEDYLVLRIILSTRLYSRQVAGSFTDRQVSRQANDFAFDAWSADEQRRHTQK